MFVFCTVADDEAGDDGGCGCGNGIDKDGCCCCCGAAFIFFLLSYAFVGLL